MTTRRPALAADPRLPFRDLLLDPAVVGKRLPALLDVPAGVPVGPVTRARTKYRVGQSLRVVHHVRIGDATRIVSTRMAPPDRAARLVATAGVGAATVDGLRAVAHDAPLGAVSWVFPRDRKIGHLGEFVTPGAPLQAILGAARPVLQLVAYAPEKSATARCEDASGRVLGYAKVYADAASAAAALARSASAAGLAGTDAVRIPRILGFLPDQHLIVLEAMPGRRLDELPPGDLGCGLAALARALAALHRLPGDGAPPLTRFAPDRLRAAAELLASARPDCAADAAALADMLSEWQPDPGVTLVHGDVHLKNALLTGNRLSLLDLDQLCAGSPAADVGSLLAALRHARLVGALSAADHERLEARFVATYAEHADFDDAAVRWHTAAALLVERALRAINRVLPATLDRMGDLLAEAAALAGDRRALAGVAGARAGTPTARTAERGGAPS